MWGGETDVTPPTINSPLVTLSTLPSSGGQVTIKAVVTDDQGVVARVWVEIQKPDGSTVSADLSYTQGTSYQAQWTAPANALGNPAIYKLTLKARDVAGNNCLSSPMTVTVAGAQVADRTPPAISNAVVTPNTLRFTGGIIVIRADVTDDSGVKRVWAEVKKYDGSTNTVELTQAQGTTYKAQWAAPANPSVGGNTITYSVSIKAQDTANNSSSSSALSMTVSGVGNPPTPPTL